MWVEIHGYDFDMHDWLSIFLMLMKCITSVELIFSHNVVQEQ